MWPVGSVSLKPVEFDFSSSDGGKRPTRALVAEGEILVEIALLDDYLAAVNSSQSVATAVPANAYSKLYLDGRAITEWLPLSRDRQGGPALRLGSDIHVWLVEVSA